MDGARGPGIDTPAGYTRLQRRSTGAEADIYRADDRGGRRVTLKLFHRYAGGRAQEAAFAAHCAASVGLGRHPRRRAGSGPGSPGRGPRDDEG